VKSYFPSAKTIPVDPTFSKDELTAFVEACHGPSRQACPEFNRRERPAESPLNVRQALLHAAQVLRDADIETSHLDAEVLLQHVLGLGRSELYTLMDSPLIDASKRRHFWRLIERRAAQEPVAYITGRKEFWSLDFVVTRDVLIPRPETEFVVDIALRHLGRAGKQEAGSGLDLGTGSGVLAVCLAKECAGMRMTAIDISYPALAVAQDNSQRHGVADRIQFLCGDLFQPLSRGDYRLIVANPPYVRRPELTALPADIRKWEPMIALDGGVDGLEFYRRIVGAARHYLASGGRLVVEIGADMGEAVAALFSTAGGYAAISVNRDYAGCDRVISAIKV
jgi:release factor glutamine methyltransferase